MEEPTGKPLVVIFGRTNVGKSTLFNTLTERRQALISDIPGTTRDSNLSTVEWRGYEFELVDTGGFMDLEFLSKRKIKAETIDEFVQKQARDYLKKADVVLFVVDSKDGLLKQDREMAIILKRILPNFDNVIIVANKVDNLRRAPETSQFFKLGLAGNVHAVSAATGAGTGDLLDALITYMPAPEAKAETDEDEEAEEPEEKSIKAKRYSRKKKDALDDEDEESTDDSDTELSDSPFEDSQPNGPLRICLLGKPNVGKSSLMNAILGYNRVIVSPTPHTTREPQSSKFKYKDRDLVLVDTAGLTRHGHKSDTLEKYSMGKSLATLKKAQVALLILDINEEITKQDARLVEEIFESHKSLIIIANKWDKVPEHDTKKYTNYIYGELPFATWAPIQFVSAKHHAKIDHLLDMILDIDRQRHLRISASQLQRLMRAAIKKHYPTKGRGTKYPRLYAFEQTGTNPPSFMVRIGAQESLAESYLRFLENQLRSRFGFLGTPISMWVQKGRAVHGAQGTPGSKVRKD